MHLSPVRNPYRHGDMMSGSLGISAGTGISGMSNQPSYIQPRPGRLPKDRPIVKLSVSLIDTYKEINRVSRMMYQLECAYLIFFYPSDLFYAVEMNTSHAHTFMITRLINC